MIKHLGTGIAGRPKGICNSQININWHNLCKDCMHYSEFKVVDDVIIYPISKDEYLEIYPSNNIENEYQMKYCYKGLKIKCQTLDNNDLDSLLNKLMSDDWDYSITLNARVKTFKC